MPFFATFGGHLTHAITVNTRNKSELPEVNNASFTHQGWNADEEADPLAPYTEYIDATQSTVFPLHVQVVSEITGYSGIQGRLRVTTNTADAFGLMLLLSPDGDWILASERDARFVTNESVDIVVPDYDNTTEKTPGVIMQKGATKEFSIKISGEKVKEYRLSLNIPDGVVTVEREVENEWVEVETGERVSVGAKYRFKASNSKIGVVRISLNHFDPDLSDDVVIWVVPATGLVVVPAPQYVLVNETFVMRAFEDGVNVEVKWELTQGENTEVKINGGVAGVTGKKIDVDIGSKHSTAENDIKIKYTKTVGENPPTGTHEMTAIEADLDIVKFGTTDTNEHVAEADEEKGSKGACLSLNREAGHLRPILIRAFKPAAFTGKVGLFWDDAKTEIYENPQKTPASKITSGKEYALGDLPKRLYVEAIQASTKRAGEKIILKYMPPGGGAFEIDKICFTNFVVTMTIRDGSGPNPEDKKFSPQNENELRDYVVKSMLDGQDKLGKISWLNKQEDNKYWYGGAVEIVGQLTPNKMYNTDFEGTELCLRQNTVKKICWGSDALNLSLLAGTIIRQNEPDDITPCVYNPETKRYIGFQDIWPSLTGKIYTVDVPAVGTGAGGLGGRPKGGVLIYRISFSVYCSFKFYDEPMTCVVDNVATTRNCRAENCEYRECSDARKNYYIRITLRNTASEPIGEVDDKWEEDLCEDGNKASTTGSLDLNLKDPEVSSVEPANGATGQVITIKGKRLLPGATVKLKKGETEIDAQEVMMDIGADKKPIIKCKIPADAESGDWNIKVTNPRCDENADLNFNESARSSNDDKVFTVEP